MDESATLSLFDQPADPPPGPSDVRKLPPPPRLPSRLPRAPELGGPLLLAVDGDSVAHRVFHSYGRDDGRDDGERATAARHGFLALLCAICDRAGPDGVIVGFDGRSAASHRRSVYPDYKAGRSDRDPLLDDLLCDLPVLLDALGVEVASPAGWEADDVSASAAAAAEAADWRCVVATSDRDAFALITDRTSVLRLRDGIDNAVVVDGRRLYREYGVAAGQYLRLAALRGDKSDNLPGIQGIGPKKAAALLREYPTVEDAVADPIGCRSVLGGALGQRLLDDLACAGSVYRRNVRLMTGRRDVPVDLVRCGRSASPRTIAEALDRRGLGGLAARVAVAVGSRPAPAPPPEAPPG